MLRQFSKLVVSVNLPAAERARNPYVFLPEQIHSGRTPHGRIEALRSSPERGVVQSVDINPALLVDFQRVMGVMINAMRDMANRRGVSIPELERLIQRFENERLPGRSVILSPEFARELDLVLSNPVVRSMLPEVERLAAQRQPELYRRIQWSCSEQSRSEERLFTLEVHHYVLNQYTGRSVVRATHDQFVESPPPVEGKQALQVYAAGRRVIEQMERQRNTTMRNLLHRVREGNTARNMLRDDARRVLRRSVYEQTLSRIQEQFHYDSRVLEDVLATEATVQFTGGEPEVPRVPDYLPGRLEILNQALAETGLNVHQVLAVERVMRTAAAYEAITPELIQEMLATELGIDTRGDWYRQYASTIYEHLRDLDDMQSIYQLLTSAGESASNLAEAVMSSPYHPVNIAIGLFHHGEVAPHTAAMVSRLIGAERSAVLARQRMQRVSELLEPRRLGDVPYHRGVVMEPEGGPEELAELERLVHERLSVPGTLDPHGGRYQAAIYARSTGIGWTTSDREEILRMTGVTPHFVSSLFGSISVIDYAFRDVVTGDVSLGELSLAMDRALLELTLMWREGDVSEEMVRASIQRNLQRFGLEMDLPERAPLFGRMLELARRAAEGEYSPTIEHRMYKGMNVPWSVAMESIGGLLRFDARDTALDLALSALRGWTGESQADLIAQRFPFHEEVGRRIAGALESGVQELSDPSEVLGHVLHYSDLDLAWNTRIAYELALQAGITVPESIARAVQSWQNDAPGGYTGNVLILLPAGDETGENVGAGIRFYRARVENMPLPELPFELFPGREPLHPTEGVIAQGDRFLQLIAYVNQGNAVVLPEREFHRAFHAALQSARAAGGIQAQSQVQTTVTGSYAAGRHAVSSELLDIGRSRLEFLFEGMEMDESDVEEEYPYDAPPDIVASWRGDDINDYVVYRRRIGRGRSEKVLRGRGAGRRDVVPESEIEYLGGQAAARARALQAAMERLAARGEYTAVGPGGRLVQVQEVDEQGNLVVRDWTLHEFLRETMGEDYRLSPLPVSALAPPEEEDIDDWTVAGSRFRADLIRTIAGRARYSALYGDRAETFAPLFWRIGLSVEETLREYQDIEHVLRDPSSFIASAVGAESVEMDFARLYQSMMMYRDMVPQGRLERYLQTAERVYQFEQSLRERLMGEVSEFIGEEEVPYLLRQVIRRVADYYDDSVRANEEVFRRFIYGFTIRYAERQQVLEGLFEQAFAQYISQSVSPSVRFRSAISTIANQLQLPLQDRRMMQIVGRAFYEYLVQSGVDPGLSEQVLSRVTGMTRTELMHHIQPAESAQLTLFHMPLDRAGRATDDEEYDVEDEPQSAFDDRLQLVLPILELEGADAGQASAHVASMETAAPSYWRGSDEMLEALGFSAPAGFLYGAARRRYMTVFGWRDEMESVNREMTDEQRRELDRLLAQAFSGELSRADLSRLAALADMAGRYADQQYFDIIDDRVVHDPSYYPVTRALYHLITYDPNSRLSVALRRAYLGTAGAQASGLETLQDLGASAFAFAAEFVRTTPPGARIPELGGAIMPSDPDEVAEFLRENLLRLMIARALRSTDWETARSEMIMGSIYESGMVDDEGLTVEERVSRSIYGRVEPYTRPEQVVESEPDEPAPAPQPEPEPQPEPVSGFAEFMKRVDQIEVEKLGEAYRKRMESLKVIEARVRAQEEAAKRRAIEQGTAKQYTTQDLLEVLTPEMLDAPLHTIGKQTAQLLSKRLAGLSEYSRSDIYDEIRGYSRKRPQFPINISTPLAAEAKQMAVKQYGTEQNWEQFYRYREETLGSYIRWRFGEEFYDRLLRALQGEQIEVASRSDQPEEPVPEPEEPEHIAPDVHIEPFGQRILNVSSTRLLRGVSDVLTDLYEGRISAEEARRALSGYQLLGGGGAAPYSAMVPLWLDDERLEVQVLPGRRVLVAGRVLALDEGEEYRLPAEAVQNIPQQVERPVDMDEAANVLLQVLTQGDRPVLQFADAPGLEEVYTALDIETDPRTGRLLQAGLVTYRTEGSGDIEVTGRRLILVDTAEGREKALQAIISLARQVFEAYDDSNAYLRAMALEAALGLKREQTNELLEFVYNPPEDFTQIAERIISMPGVLRDEREALEELARRILYARGRLVVQNVAFDIPFIAQRLMDYGMEDEAEDLERILSRPQHIIDVAELGVRAGHVQVNLQALGRATGVLEQSEREAHRALEDAELAARVSARLYEQIEESEYQTLQPGQYLIGIGPGRLYDVSGAVPEQVIGLRDRVFRVVQAVYSTDQNRVSVELEEMAEQEGQFVPVRTLRFEPTMGDAEVNPLWQASLEMTRMFVAANEEEARRVYQLGLQDAFRREVERILAPDLPPSMTVRPGQQPSEYEREGLITTMMTVLRARAIAEGIEDANADWVRETLGSGTFELDQALAEQLAQRTAYYLTLPYARDPRRQEVYRQVWEWWQPRREALGGLMNQVLEYGRANQLSWAEMTGIWRELIAEQMQDLPTETVQVPEYRSETMALNLALARGGFATISVPMGIPEPAQEAWILHRVRTQLRRQVLNAEFADSVSGRMDVFMLTALSEAGADEQTRSELLQLMAQRRAIALQLETLEGIGDEMLESRIEDLRSQMGALTAQYLDIFQPYRERIYELLGYSAEQFGAELARNAYLRESLDEYILRVAVPVDTSIARWDYTQEFQMPDIGGDIMTTLRELGRPQETTTERVLVENYMPQPFQVEEERMRQLVRQMRYRTAAERIQGLADELGLGFRVTQADISTRIPMHSAVVALHQVLSEAANEGVAVTREDIVSRWRELLGTEQLQIGRYHTLDLTNPRAAEHFLRYLMGSSRWIRQYASMVDEQWLEWALRETHRLAVAAGDRARVFARSNPIVLQAPGTTPFPEEYMQWVQAVWQDVNQESESFQAFTPFQQTVVTQTPAGATSSGGAPKAPGGAGSTGNRGYGEDYSWVHDFAQGLRSHGANPYVTVGAMFADDLLVLGLSIGAYLWHRRRRKREDDDEGSLAAAESRQSRGTGIVGNSRFVVHADPFSIMPGGHIRFHSDYRRPSQHRLRRMERDMEGLL